jgi:hypothetical protein
LTDPHTVTVRLPVTDKPDVLDWLGRKVIVTPRTVELIYRPGIQGPATANITGPARPAPRIQPFHGDMTITYDHQHPEHWPQWLRDLGTEHTPPGLH